MGVDFIWTLLISLGLTLALELTFALIFGVRGKRDFLLIVLVNLITNPAVVLLYYLLMQRAGTPWVITAALLESAAVLIEGCYYNKYARTIKRPFLFSLGANAFSYIMGLLLMRIV